jgi:hypothetical protein
MKMKKEIKAAAKTAVKDAAKMSTTDGKRSALAKMAKKGSKKGC